MPKFEAIIFDLGKVIFDFKPTEAEMSFGEQLKHFTDNLLWLHGDFILLLSNRNPVS